LKAVFSNMDRSAGKTKRNAVKTVLL